MSLYPGRKMPSNEAEWREWCDGQKFDFTGGAINGWDDYTADLNSAKVPGSGAPTWTQFRDGIYAYEFSAAAENSLTITFHIRHDYCESTKVYPHLHFSTTSTNTGVVRIGFEYTTAKGHDQEAFPSTSTVYVNYNIASNKQYQHLIAEVADADAFDAQEADSLVLMRIFRDGGDAADTFAATIHAFTADLHYQADKIVTPNKSPPFY